MPRQLLRSTPDAGNINIVVPITKGGTGANNPADARANLGAIDREIIGQPNGLLQADDYGYVPESLFIEMGYDVGYHVAGPRTLVHGVQGRYRITNFSSAIPADLDVSAGSVERFGDEFVIYPPTTGDSLALTINHREITINLVDSLTTIPELFYPTRNNVVPKHTTFISKPFTLLPSQVSAWKSITKATTSLIPPSNAAYLEVEGKKGVDGVARILMNEKTYDLGTSTVWRRIPIELYGNITFKTSGTGTFKWRWVYDAVKHTASDWQIATDEAFTNIVYESLNNTKQLRELPINLDEGNYFVRVRYHGVV